MGWKWDRRNTWYPRQQQSPYDTLSFPSPPLFCHPMASVCVCCVYCTVQIICLGSDILFCDVEKEGKGVFGVGGHYIAFSAGKEGLCLALHSRTFLLLHNPLRQMSKQTHIWALYPEIVFYNLAIFFPNTFKLIVNEWSENVLSKIQFGSSIHFPLPNWPASQNQVLLFIPFRQNLGR